MAEMTLEEALAAATVDEELITPVNDILTINPETREISVPESEALFGVEGDIDVERKYFRCPRIVGDNIDLSEHQIYISYAAAKNKNGTFLPEIMDGLYHCDDVAVDGDYITFSWRLSGNVLSVSGYVGFKVLAKYNDGEELKDRWSTAPAIGMVLATVPDGKSIAERYPDVIAHIIEQLKNSDSAIGKLSEDKVSNPATAQIGQILEVETVDENGKPLSYKAVDKPTSNDLPEVTTEDNGKFLQVVNGKWTAVAITNGSEVSW